MSNDFRAVMNAYLIQYPPAPGTNGFIDFFTNGVAGISEQAEIFSATSSRASIGNRANRIFGPVVPWPALPANGAKTDAYTQQNYARTASLRGLADILTGVTTQLVIPVTYVAFVPTASGLTSAQAQAAIIQALAVYFASVPLGGIVPKNAPPIGVVPRTSILSAIAGAIAGTQNITLAAPTVDSPLLPQQTPALGTVTATINFY